MKYDASRIFPLTPVLGYIITGLLLFLKEVVTTSRTES